MHAHTTRRQPTRLLLALLLALPLLLVPAAKAAAACPCTIFSATSTPKTPADNDRKAVELGVKFRSDVNGWITGIRFYKSTANTGTHVGSLWSSAGSLLGQATFQSESASGWQQVSFSQPVAVTANTTYVASYHTNVGRYANDDGAFATAGVDTPPLHALANGVSGPNGVYRYGASSAFPNTGSSSTNYWVDVVFTDSLVDTTPPSVTTRSPASGATGVTTTTDVRATFSEAVQASTVSMALSSPSGAVAGTTSYDAPTTTARFAPSQPLATSTTYTVTVSGAKDAAGNTMATTSWSFTTGSGSGGCPCTVWPASATPATANVADNNAVELGVKVRSDQDGFITGLRFYKGSGNTGTHIGHLWSATGTLLAQATFTAESASGWQQVDLPGPVAVSKNTTYVASYHTDTGSYSANNDFFATAGVDNAPLHALRDGLDGGNGVYRYGGSAFPDLTYRSSNYWVDVVFNQTASDTSPPVVTTKVPAAGATSVPATTPVAATFNEPVQGGTVSMTLTGPSGAVAGSTTYDAGSQTATFSPSGTLASSTQYTVTVSGAKDTAGNTMAPVSWSFTTATPPPPPPDQGPGGPVLVVTSSANPFTSYYAEILRAEGFDEFSTTDVTAFTAASLTGRDVVVVAETGLNASQVTALSDFVTAGGTVIAMRPDAQLDGLLGITRGSGSQLDGYVAVNASDEAGAGISGQTMQFHGSASRFTPSGSTSVATLYSSATSATSFAAVTRRTVGTNGGQAIAFGYDLARSVVLTRQGNPAWAGQERDGTSPIRSDDQFFGGTVADWVDLTKVAVPSADEQQRLFANLITTAERHRMPLPRFWYFPSGYKAVVIATGDDHGNGGTSGRFDQYLANSPAGCSVADWTCPRFTSYIYPSTPLTNAKAGGYDQQGFEVGLHVSTNCADYTPDSLESNFASQLSTWQAKYTALQAPRTNRTHCIAWSDWAGEPTAEGNHAIRLDTNYYYWPGSWITDRPGFFTGSGMPMRFAQPDGTILDVYQAATQMTDESDQSYPATPAALLDGALGANGFYGAFTANVHTDSATTFQSDQLLATAQSRNVPLITSRQILTWLDARNASAFKGLSWSGSTLTFSISIGSGARNLTAMVPTKAAGGALLRSLTLGGSAVTYRTDTIKGIEYAIFPAAAGTYAATYGTTAGATTLAGAAAKAGRTAAQATWSSARVGSHDAAGRASTLTGVAPSERFTTSLAGTPAAAAPVISAVRATGLPDRTASVTWTTDVPAQCEVRIGTSAQAQPRRQREYEVTTDHEVSFNGLRPATTYFFRVRCQDRGAPVESPVVSLAMPAAGDADSRLAQFRTGNGNGVTVTHRKEGELQLAPGRTSGSYDSRVLDTRQMVSWTSASWDADLPGGTAVKVSVRTGSTRPQDDTWSPWTPVPGNGASLRGLVKDSRFLQYRIELTGTPAATPVVHSIGFSSSAVALSDPTETGGP